MPALNFSPEFADAVENGTKRQTIRWQRKKPIEAGDTLYLYTGQRTKSCRKLRTDQCASVTPIRIIQEGMRIYLNGLHLHYDDARDLARRDGFHNPVSMCEWFAKRYGPKFEGVLICW